MLILNSCAGHGTFTYTSPQFEINSISRAKVLVLPFISKFLTPNQKLQFTDRKNRLRRPITSKEVGLIDNYLHLMIQERTPASIIEFEQQKMSDTLNLIADTLKTEKGAKIPAFVPQKSGIEYNGIIPDFLFLVEDAFFLKSGDASGRSLGRESVDFFVMESGMNYLLWDNKTGAAVSFGRVEKDLKLLVLPDKKFYLMMLEKLADDILQNSPLKFRKVYF